MSNRLFSGAEVLFYVLIYSIAIVARWPLPAWVLVLTTALLVIYPVVSNLLQRKTRFQIGLHPSAFLPAFKLSLLCGLPLIALLLIIGWNEPLLRPGVAYRLMLGGLEYPIGSAAPMLAMYPVWALVQQYILMGFLFERVETATDRRPVLPLFICWVLFTAAHWPNMALLRLTFVGGGIFLLIFRRHRNWIPIALLHGVLGILAYRTLADRAFTVGRYYVG